jgi:acetyltransferase EpsM
MIGGGGHAQTVKALAKSCGWEITLVLDVDPIRRREVASGHRLGEFSPDLQCGPISDLPMSIGEVIPARYAILAIGDNTARKKFDVEFPGVRWARLVHPRSVVDRAALISDGDVVCAGGIINAGARVGRHVIVNTGAIVEHDVQVASYSHIAPNATLCGDVEIMEGALIGAGSVILPGRRVGSWSVVGAGTVVTADVPDHAVSMGVPNRITGSAEFVSAAGEDR